MSWRFVRISAFAFFLVGAASAQDVEIVREKKPVPAKPEAAATKQVNLHADKTDGNAGPLVETKKPKPIKSEAAQSIPLIAKQPATVDPAKIATKPKEDRSASANQPSRKATAGQEATAAKSILTDQGRGSTASEDATAVKSEAVVQQAKYEGATAFIKLADGFDFPVGKPNGKGYYKARGFRSRGHLGEDWDGLGGGDTDLGDPIYCIGDGIVVFARDCKMGWGNVIIVRHVYRDGDAVKNIDSFYGHLQKILVHRGQTVKRGQQIAKMGNAHGLYDAHLHLEIRRNIEIGMSRAAFARDFNNYYDPSQFIASHRALPKSYGSYRVAVDTFKRDEKIRWDKVRRFSGYRGGGSSQSAVALKKALVSQGAGTQ
jgi:murein DD-endopeptidase MepM/ murein hydrolase activator NlpD